MKTRTAIVTSFLALSLALAAPAAQARPGGCLKYGAGGAVAGHFAGHHGWRGAALGCALGAWKRHTYNRRMRESEHY
jgi:hypothetical protein